MVTVLMKITIVVLYTQYRLDDRFKKVLVIDQWTFKGLCLYINLQQKETYLSWCTTIHHQIEEVDRLLTW